MAISYLILILTCNSLTGDCGLPYEVGVVKSNFACNLQGQLAIPQLAGRGLIKYRKGDDTFKVKCQPTSLDIIEPPAGTVDAPIEYQQRS